MRRQFAINCANRLVALGSGFAAGGESFLIPPVVSTSFYVNRHGVVIVYCSPSYYRPCSVS